MIQQLLLSLFVATAALAQQEMPGPVYVWINGVRYETGLLERAQTWTALNRFTVNRPAGHTLFNRNTAVDGISGPAFFDDGGTARGGVGWRNASDGIGPNSLTLHTFGAHPVQVATNNTVRAFFDDGGFRPSAANIYDHGSASLYWKDSWNKQVYTQTLRISNNPGTFSTAFYVDMHPAANELRWYDPANTLVLNLNAAVTPRRWTILGDLSPMDTNGTIGFYNFFKSASARNFIGLTDNSSPAGHFTTTVGSTAPEVLYVSGALASKRGIYVAGSPAIVAAGHIEPDVDNTYNLGSETKRFAASWLGTARGGEFQTIPSRAILNSSFLLMYDAGLNETLRITTSTGIIDSIGQLRLFSSGVARFQASTGGWFVYNSLGTLRASVSSTTGVIDAQGYTTAGSGNITQTLTVRNAADTGSCTITISGSLVTASTC